MASGLKKAETNEHEPKLFKVAGGIRPVMTEVSSVDMKSLTFTCFMFDEVKRVKYQIPDTKFGILQYDIGSNGLVVDEPRGRVCPRLGEEDLCVEGS